MGAHGGRRRPGTVTRRALPTVPWQQLPANYRETLRDLGHTKQTYEKIQQAEQLLRAANDSMRRRSGATQYWIGSRVGPPDIIWRRR